MKEDVLLITDLEEEKKEGAKLEEIIEKKPKEEKLKEEAKPFEKKPLKHKGN